eukprot:GHVU01137564.1.p1 GENE.GHVU01137564.1~~GHVU01137564.1.p1  ORF type:complete len:126 (-),score=4.77 GHVU01137564.1:522-899(-)
MTDRQTIKQTTKQPHRQAERDKRAAALFLCGPMPHHQANMHNYKRGALTATALTRRCPGPDGHILRVGKALGQSIDNNSLSSLAVKGGQTDPQTDPQTDNPASMALSSTFCLSRRSSPQPILLGT